MTQKGKVVSVTGSIARVRVIRRSACDGCRQKSICTGLSDGCAEHEQAPLEADARNTAGADVGDDVIVETKSRTVLLYAFLIFILPIVLAMAVYLALNRFCFGQTIIYAGTAAVFIASAGLFCFLLNCRLKKNLCVEIVKIVEKDN